MNRSIAIGIFILMLAAGAVYVAAYAISYDGDGKEAQAQRPETEAETLADASSVTQEEILAADTEYIVIAYVLETGAVQEEETKLPIAYIACTREEIAQQLQAYTEDPSIEDLQEGFVEASLVTFSAEQLVVQKSYSADKAGYLYCILNDGGMLTVYYVDRKTVYEYTDIAVATLPNSVQLEVADGKYFETLQQVFAFLESYSS